VDDFDSSRTSKATLVFRLQNNGLASQGEMACREIDEGGP